MAGKWFMPNICMLMFVISFAFDAYAGSPRMNYMLHCSGCHGQDGSGNPASGIPDMRGKLGHFFKVESGRAFLIQVPGTSHANLNDAEVAELINWLVRTFSKNEMPNDTPPYTASEVTQLRHHPLTDVSAKRLEISTRLKEIGVNID